MTNGYSPISEQRQYLNISYHAFETLADDIDIFSERGGMSGIVNRILLNYMESSEATISSAVERKRQEYIGTIQRNKAGSHILSGENLPNLSSSERKTIEFLLSEYRSKLTNHYLYELPPKEKAFTIRLQNKIYKTLCTEPLQDKCYKSTGEYIRAILEDYTSKSLFQREIIYFREMHEIIRSKLLIPQKNRSLTTIKSRSVTGILQTFRVKPYALSKESDASYHYLIALSKLASDKNSVYKPAAFRLSRIEEFYDTPGYGSGKITEKEKKAVEDSIKMKSIPYLLNDINDYTVELTPSGIIKYKTILHLRPIADSSKTEHLHSGGKIMHFTCTYRQIENYFFQFGKEAKLISPKKDAERFKSAYKAAYEAYT